MTVTAEQIAAAEESGLTNVAALAAACDHYGFPFHLACTILDKETRGANIYGHDKGGAFTVFGKNIDVTEANYREFRRLVDAGHTSNGVGPMQLTWRGFFPEMEKQGLKPWVPAENILYGVGLLAGYLKKSDFWHTAKSYNGGASYADDAVKRAVKWLTLVGKDDTTSAPDRPTTDPGGTVTNISVPLNSWGSRVRAQVQKFAAEWPDFSWGTYPGHDPSEALATDGMVPGWNKSGGKAKGRKVAQAIWDDRNNNGVWYVIHWGQIISITRPEQGWVRYYQADNPDPSKSHHNHVHVSWHKDSAAPPVAPVTPTTPAESGEYPTPQDKIVYVSKLKPGQKDSDSVWWVQKALGVPLTGTYDRETVYAVQAFQHALGDDVDGELGPLETAALFTAHPSLGVTVLDKP